MVWDALLVGVFLHNVVRSMRRGGKGVAVELCCFALTYAATFSLGPALAALVRGKMEHPPPLLSFLSFLAIYLLARRALKLALPTLRLGPTEHDSAPPVPEATCEPSPASLLCGALLGAVRGSVVAAGVASLGFCLGIVQQAGGLRGVPLAETSFAVSQAAGVVEFVADRYTLDAGPTTKLMFDVALHPDDDEGVRKLLESPLVQRVKSSDEVIAFTKDAEVRALVEDRRTAQLLVHPAFLRVIQFSMNELRSE